MEVPNLRIRIVSNIDMARDFWEWLTSPGRTFVACDIETTGLDWWAPTFKVRMIQFGDELGGWAIDFEGWRRLVEAAFDWCWASAVMVVGHNFVGYDTLALRRSGIEMDWRFIADTFVLASLGGYAEQSRKLKDCGVRELGLWAGQGENVLKKGMANQGWTWADIPMSWRPYPLYGVLDTCITALLWVRWQWRYITWRDAHDLEVAAARITGIMADNGLPIDRPYCLEKLGEQHQKADELAAKLSEYGVEPTKLATVAKAIEADGGFPAGHAVTKTGQYSTSAEALSNVDHPVAKLITEWRLVTRIAKNYLGELYESSAYDGTVHPGIKSIEAATGRMSIERPALQQLPDGPLVRSAVIGRGDPATAMVISSDWSQIELRLWASMTKDTALIEAIKAADASPVDFFTSLCRVIYNEPDYTKGQDHRRTQVKSSMYAKLFGGSLDVAAQTAGVTPYSMAPTWRKLEVDFPSLKENNLVDSGHENGKQIWFATSPVCNRRFATADPRLIRKLANHVTQGTAALVLKRTLVELDAVGLTDHLLLPVHDEVLASSDTEEVEMVAHVISDVMNAAVPEDEWGVTVPAEPGWGKNWAEAK